MYPNPAELRAGRSLLGLTQEDAAKMAGISVRTLISVEQGRGTITGLHAVMGALMAMGLRYDMTPDGQVTITYRRPEPPPERLRTS